MKTLKSTRKSLRVRRNVRSVRRNVRIKSVKRKSVRMIRKNTKRKSRKSVPSKNRDRVISRLYGLNDKQTECLCHNIEKIKKYKRVKQDMMRWFKGKVHTHEFRDEVFDFSALSGIREANAIMKEALECVDDLLDEVVFTICDGYINYSKLIAIICACFSIALKLLSSADWVYDRELMRELYQICISSHEYKNKRCKSDILKMESDILRRTQWKPCKNIF